MKHRELVERVSVRTEKTGLYDMGGNGDEVVPLSDPDGIRGGLIILLDGGNFPASEFPVDNVSGLIVVDDDYVRDTRRKEIPVFVLDFTFSSKRRRTTFRPVSASRSRMSFSR